MGLLAVLLAAVAAWIFGAGWYMTMARPWMAAAGLKAGDIDRKNPAPFMLSFFALILVAGMMRHIFVMAGIDVPVKAFWSGLGLGLFLVTPWIATNYMYAQRPIRLMLIDGTYATVGCAIIGVILTLF